MIDYHKYQKEILKAFIDYYNDTAFKCAIIDFLIVEKYALYRYSTIEKHA